MLQIADGRILSGSQALESGLIDRLGNRTDALATAGRMAGLGAEPRTVRPPEPRATIWDVLLGTAAARILGRMAGPLDDASVPYLKFSIPTLHPM